MTDYNTFTDLSDIRTDITELSMQDRMEEFMFLGLRLTEGISKCEFAKVFDKDYETVYGFVTEKLLRQGLIFRDKDRVALTDRGIDVSNMVLSEFLF